jgi:hypothetical protein
MQAPGTVMLQRTPYGNDFLEGGQRRREFFRVSSSAVLTCIPAKAFSIGTSGQWREFYFSAASKGGNLISTSHPKAAATTDIP